MRSNSSLQILVKPLPHARFAVCWVCSSEQDGQVGPTRMKQILEEKIMKTH